MKINSLQDLEAVRDTLPKAVMDDILKRINDWITSRGQLSDPYVKRQYYYAEQVIDLLEKNRRAE